MTELSALFDCPRVGPLTHRACLRRQVEMQESTKRGALGPPVRPYCASGECEKGRAVRGAHPDLQLEACTACGSALFAGEACETCAARAREKAPAKQAPLPRIPVSTRVWEPQPDVPFVPPAAPRAPTVHPEPAAQPAPAVGEAEMADGRAAIAAASPSPSSPPEPESPAMPTGTRAAPMPCCGSKGSRHMSICPNAKPFGKKKAAAPKKRTAPAEPSTVVRALADIAPARLAEAVRGFNELELAPGRHLCDPRQLSDEDLEACIAEARRRVAGRARLEAVLAGDQEKAA